VGVTRLVLPAAPSTLRKVLEALDTLPEEVWRDEVAPEVRGSLSDAAYGLLDDTATRVLTERQVWWVTAGFALALWEVAAATRVTMTALDRIYGFQRRRGFFEVFPRSVWLGLTMGVALLAAVAVVRFVPLLTGLFVFIFLNNLFKITPGIMFPPTSRIAIPGLLALTVRFLFIGVGIKDTGIGINREDQLRLFEPFAQADNSGHLARSGGGDYGVHSEMFTDGLMIGFLSGVIFCMVVYRFVLQRRGRSTRREIDALVQQFQDHFRNNRRSDSDKLE
jgi:hypothetical protein